MRFIILFSLFCVVFANEDVGGCEPLSPTQTVKKSGRKALDKCIEYQETLVYPCEKSTSPTGGQKRSDNCQLKNNDSHSAPVPHMVLLGYGDNSSHVQWLCGGTLLSDKFVLAAAHCKLPVGDTVTTNYVKVGAQHIKDYSRENIFKVKSVTQHPEYKAPKKYNDIALIELDTSVPLNRNTVPACLPVDEDLKDDEAVHSFYPSNCNHTVGLQQMTLTKFSHEECSELYPPYRWARNGIDSITQMCYGEIDISENGCTGNTGGPLQIKNSKIDCMYTVTGVVSYGYLPASRADVFTRVAHYVPWIESVVWP